MFILYTHAVFGTIILIIWFCNDLFYDVKQFFKQRKNK